MVLFLTFSRMAKVYLRKDVEIDIPEAAYEYARRLCRIEDKEKEN